jgi:hypothetical protein
MHPATQPNRTYKLTFFKNDLKKDLFESQLRKFFNFHKKEKREILESFSLKNKRENYNAKGENTVN